MRKDYDTLSEAIADLQARGYTEDLNLQENCLTCRALNLDIHAVDFEVDEMYRFEGDSNPDDASVLYAISAEKHQLKGVLVDAYGAYADPVNAELIAKLKYKPS